MSTVFNELFTSIKKQLGVVISGNRKILEKIEKIEEIQSEQLLIVKANKPLRQIDMWTIKEVIDQQRPSGTIILPHDCEVILAPKDIEIKIEEARE